MNEKELLSLAKTDESAVEELLEIYKPLASKIARRYFLLSGDTDDLVQEGMIGLYKAIKGFDDSKDASFKTFASLCINRQISSLVRREHAQKNEVFLDLFGTEVLENLDVPSNRENPEQTIISNQNMAYIEEQIKSQLSEFETKVLSLYLDGLSYEQIANEINKTLENKTGEFSRKNVDNALSRVRLKLSHLLDDIK